MKCNHLGYWFNEVLGEILLVSNKNYEEIVVTYEDVAIESYFYMPTFNLFHAKFKIFVFNRILSWPKLQI
jgi:hypothetical protein